MAAGDITIAGSNFTPADFDKIAAEVTIRIASTSKDPGQYEVASSLQGITSIPVFHQSGSTYKLVRVLVSILKGVDGKEVHLQVSESGYIQWRWTDGMWNNLVAIKDLKGDKGDTPVFRTGASGIEWKYTSEEDSAYRILVGYDILRLKFSDMTSEQIAAFWHQVPADVVALFQKPATDAAARADEKMVQISEDVNLLKQDFIDDGNLLKQEFTTAGNNLLDRVETDADKINTDLTTAVEALEERAETVISETNTAKVAAETATTNAGNATTAANDAAGLANTAANDANKATELAVVAAKLADEKAKQASTAADKADTAAGVADNAAALANEKATLANDAAGVADTATGNANTAIGNAETATKRANDAAEAAEGVISGVRPDWAAGKESPNYIKNKPEIPTVQVAPGADTISYVNTDGTLTTYRIGDEVRVMEDDEYVFYRLYDLSDGIASWQESGSGTALPGNIYLQGATYYNKSVRIIKKGYLNE